MLTISCPTQGIWYGKKILPCAEQREGEKIAKVIFIIYFFAGEEEICNYLNNNYILPCVPSIIVYYKSNYSSSFY